MVLYKYRVRKGSWIGKSQEEYDLEDYLDALQTHVEELMKRIRKLEEQNVKK